MKLKNLDDIFLLLNFLVKEKIKFQIYHSRDDAIGVRFSVVTKRIECEFFKDDFLFSVYSGDETLEDDSDILFKLVAKHWGD